MAIYPIEWIKQTPT